jgi:competence protein ComEC
MQTKSITSSKILFFFSICFIFGIFVESILNLSQILICGFLIVAVVIIFINLFFNKKYFFVLGFCVLFFVLGVLRFQISEFEIENNNLKKLNGQEVSITGIVSAEPDIRDNYQKLKIKNQDSIILATTNLYPKYNYLDTIKLEGKLEEPQEDDEFSYKKYLMKDGIYSVMFFPKIEVIGKSGGNPVSAVYEKILFLKQKIRDSIQYNFLPPQSSILEGTILGDNGAMSQELKDKLNITGLRHVIAVSGTHVVILSSIIMSILLAVGFKRQNAFYLALFSICFYVVLTGFPASGVRAGIMGGLYLTAQKLGRQSMGIRVIVLAASVMLIFNPLLLIYDVGFQLSFLAVMGLIYLEPVFTKIFKLFTKNKLENLIKIISATFAAQIFTLPILVYSFGNISFVSPITNLLVLPIVYWLMIFGFLASFIGIFSVQLGWIVSVPCYFVLKYFLWVIDFFSQPWAIKTFENVHWIWLVVLYILVAISTRYLNKKFTKNL